MICFIVAFVTFPCVQGVAWSNIYKWTDENGKMHFSDKPPLHLQAEEIQEKHPTMQEAVTPTVAIAATGEKQIAITSFTIEKSRADRGFLIATIQLINRGETVIEPVRCRIQYTALSQTGSPIMPMSNMRHAHPEHPSQEQVDAEVYHSHSREYSRTHPDGHRIVHSMLPGQEAACRIRLLNTKFITLMVSWSKDASSPRFSTIRYWSPK